MFHNFAIKFVSMAFIFFVAVILSWGSHAQVPSCETPRELIFKLRAAQIGSYGAWDYVNGAMQTRDRYVTGYALGDEDGVLLIGERDKKESADVFLTIARLDKRGRLSWQKSHNVSGLLDVLKIVPTQDGFFVVGNMRDTKNNHAIWTGRITTDGSLVREAKIKKHSMDLKAHDVIAAHDGKSYLIAASKTQKGESLDARGMIYRVNNIGKVLSEKTYLSSPNNKILGLAPYGDQHYLAIGYVDSNRGVEQGWLMKISDDGGLDWQRQYPRGMGAQFKYAQQYSDHEIILAGDSQPAIIGGGPYAGWVMLVDGANGNITWQRYYTGSPDYQAAGLLVNNDKVISVLLKAKSKDEKLGLFTRILSINPRGYLLSSDAFFNGRGVRPHQFISGSKGRRIIIGASDVAYDTEDSDTGEKISKISEDAWVLAAPAPDPYQDPCALQYGAQ